MERKELEESIGKKISKELQDFKCDTLKKGKEEIFSLAFKIDSVVNIYEFILENMKWIAEDGLQCLLRCPNLLLFLYEKWVKYEDNYEEDLTYCINREMTKLRNAYLKERGLIG